MSPAELAADYDWGEVLKYAKEGVNFIAPPGEAADALAVQSERWLSGGSGFTAADVVEVLAHADGENDGPDWVVVVRLRFGTFAVVRAGCDYTGWGCQEGGSADVALTLPDLCRWGLTEEERTRCRLTPDGEFVP